ncbi:MAG: polysaccharide deacetylase family protein [Cyclobacteriaceae bacterium]
MPTNEKKLYLTFDDGPVNGPTEFVLEELKRFDAKATFFCIGNNVEQHPQIHQRILQEGHAVGNHTFNHIKGWNVSVDSYLKDVERCQNLVGPTKLFRPPYGRAKRSQLKKLSDYRIVMWDVLSYDYSNSVAKETCLKGVIRASRSGSIIVFHDSYKAEKNMMHALPRVLDHFKQSGYQFESLSDL